MTPERVLCRTLTGDLSWTDETGWDVEAVVRAAGDHGVGGLIWRALESPRSEAGVALRERLSPAVRAAAARDLLVQRELGKVLAALEAAGVRALVVKGAALAYSAYAEPWLRPRIDTDLLVPLAEFPAAFTALEGCGYARSDAVTSGTLVSHQLAFVKTDDQGMRHVLDLHWKPVNPQVLADALPFDLLWADRRDLPALGPSARTPSPIASLGLGCIHRLAHHHGLERLVWLYDFREITARFEDGDWGAFAQLACSRGIAALCLDGLQKARDSLASRLPDSVEAVLASAAAGEASRIFLEPSVRKRHVLASDLAVLTDWRARLRLLREHAFPPAAFIRQRYGAENRWPLPALYLHRLVTGAVRWVRP